MSDDSKIEASKIGWENAVVMVCTKCGKQFNDLSNSESPERIKSELKFRVKAEFGKSIRVITTSCLNICPVDKIAIVVASSEASSVFKAYVVDPDTNGEDLFENIFKKN